MLDEIVSQRTPTTGKGKLRILGLTTPEKAIKQALSALQSNNRLREALRLTHSKGLEILGENSTYTENFESPTLILRDDDNTNGILEEEGLHVMKNSDPFKKLKPQYSFSHGFLTKAEQSDTRLSVVQISGEAIDSTIKDLGEGDFKILEKSLGALLFFANHDYTMHRHGLAQYRDKSQIHDLFDYRMTKFGIEFIATQVEVLSAVFHRDMIDELSESGCQIFNSIEKHSNIILRLILGINDLDLRNYWLKILKYPLYSLLDNESVYQQTSTLKSKSRDTIKRVKESNPKFKLKQSYWGEAVHTKNIEILGRGIIPKVHDFTIRRLRQIVMKGLREESTTIQEDLIAEICRNHGLEQKVTTWEELDSELRKKEFYERRSKKEAE